VTYDADADWGVTVRPKGEQYLQLPTDETTRAPRILWGNDSPEGVISGKVGDVYMQRTARTASAAQYARPDADDLVSRWGVAPLFSKINEAAANDTPFISCVAAFPSCEFTLGMSALVDNGGMVADDDYVLRIRCRMNGGAIGVDFLHLTGSVSSGSFFNTITTSWQTLEWTLDLTDRTALVAGLDLAGWDALTVNFGTTSGAIDMDIAWVEFEAPSASDRSIWVKESGDGTNTGWAD